jgi:hypothetical protein
MRRYNYAPSPLARVLGAATERVTLPALRAPAAIVAAAFAALALTVAVDLQRLTMLDRATTVMHERADQTAADAARLAATEAELDRLRRTSSALAETRRTAIVRLNDLALLGNHLPAQTWLTRVRADRDGSWGIEGRSGRIPDVGMTIAGLQRIEPGAHIRLLSLAGAGGRAHVLRFALAWERPSP